MGYPVVPSSRIWRIRRRQGRFGGLIEKAPLAHRECLPVGVGVSLFQQGSVSLGMGSGVPETQVRSVLLSLPAACGSRCRTPRYH